MPPRSRRASAGETLEARSYRAVQQIASDCAAEVERRFPKVLRRVGGYNLDEFVDRSKPFNLAKLIVGSEGTLGLVVAAKLNLVPLPRAKAVLTIEFDELLDALAATPAIVRHRPSAVEVMDRFILDHARESPALDALRRSIMQGDAGALLCVEFYGDTPEELLPRLDALEAELPRLGYRCRWRRAVSAADQARIWSFREAALGTVDGDEGRRQVALVRRGHRGRARKTARLHRAIPADRETAPARPPASMRTRRSDASTCGPWST